MSLRSYDNSNSPRLVTVINDGQLVETAAISGQRVVVLGFSNSPTLPVQELYPPLAGTLDPAAILTASYNIDVNGKAYPSELSLALEELIKAKVTNIQVINLGLDDRMKDTIASMTRERYIALENAYDLIVDLPIDRLYPVNVVAGLKGDGMYNENTDSTITVGQGLEVIYDTEAYAAASDSEKNLSSIPGYVKVIDEAYEKAPVAGGEDLVYQLASICSAITSNGTLCTGMHRTISPSEFKYLTKVDFSVTGNGVYFNGTESQAIAPNVWAIAKNYNNSALGGEDYSSAFADADDIIGEIRATASMADPTLGGYKTIYTLGTNQTVTGGATALEEVTWQTSYGSVSASHMKSYIRFLTSFGSNVPASLLQSGVSIVDFSELDSVSTTDNETPDNYLLFATSNSEKPASPATESILKDDNGRNIDIGYLLNRVVANSVLVAEFPGTTLTTKAFNYMTGIGQILGWYNANSSAVATTRQTTTILSQLGPISASAASSLTRCGYQLFLSMDGVYTMNRDITAGLFLNNIVRTDFINQMTVNIVKDALDVARYEGNKLIGKADSSRAREGLKQRLEQEFSKWAHPEDGRLRKPASVEVFSNGIGSVIGRITIILKLAVANEILEIRTVASLEK